MSSRVLPLSTDGGIRGAASGFSAGAVVEEPAKAVGAVVETVVVGFGASAGALDAVPAEDAGTADEPAVGAGVVPNRFVGAEDLYGL